MKALSVRQPWASMILHGQKTIEVRSWPTSHRGDLLICVSKRPHGDLPIGVALCVVNIVDCRAMTETDKTVACCDYSSGDFAWVIGSVKSVTPFAVSGRLGLFDVSMPVPKADGSDLNRRPSGWKPDALAAELHPREAGESTCVDAPTYDLSPAF